MQMNIENYLTLNLLEIRGSPDGKTLESTSQEKFKNRVASSWGAGRDRVGSHSEEGTQSGFLCRF